MSKTRDWFREYSIRLESSYSASGLIEHRVTKGSSREHQVLDMLCALLPRRVDVLRDTVIIDSIDVESPMFDAVLVDRELWPLLFQQDTITVAMIESVLAAVEVKSDLGTDDLGDIFSKSAKLRTMRCLGSGTHACPPLIVAFGYRCSNLPLAFFDFATNFKENPKVSPSLLCALRSGLFFLARPDGQTLVPASIPEAGLVPAMGTFGEDSLLVFLYFLSDLAAMGSETVQTILSYSVPVFESARVYHFDEDFLDEVSGDPCIRVKARECFKRPQETSFEQLYHDARRCLGLR